ncbi:MAG: hypothetical protein ACRDPC_20605 [Solirubrobacteraceae bacterium]
MQRAEEPGLQLVAARQTQIRAALAGGADAVGGERLHQALPRVLRIVGGIPGGARLDAGGLRHVGERRARRRLDSEAFECLDEPSDVVAEVGRRQRDRVPVGQRREIGRQG